MDILNPVSVLIVDRSVVEALELLDSLRLPNVKTVMVDTAIQASKNVKKYKYDLIIIGDRLKEGDTFDVGLHIKNGKNKNTAVACVGMHTGRLQKVLNVIGPNALKAGGKAREVAVQRILTYLGAKGQVGKG